MNEIRNVIGSIKNRKSDEMKKNENRKSELMTNGSLAIPWIIFVFSNLVLAFGEYRVWHYVNALTGRPELAWGTLAATGIGAEIWFLAWKYPLANDWQKRISVTMMFVNFGVATYIGFGDFFTNDAGQSYGADQQFLVGLVAVVLFLDIVLGIVYFLIDKQIERDRLRASTQADLMDQRNTAYLIEKTLSNAEGVLDKMQELYGRFGESNVEDMLALLAGDDGKDKKTANSLRQQTSYAKDAEIVRPTNGQPPRQ